MIPITIFIFFVFGLIVGSFLNVVILRLHTEKSFGGRSACMSCQNQLAWYELIPLFSFLTLRGRCGSCQTKISIQYPLVELTTGLAFALLFFKFQNVFFDSTLIFAGTYAYYSILFCLLIVIAVYDLKHKIIPDALSLVFGLIAFVGVFLFRDFVFYLHMPNTIELFSGILIALPFALTWLISRGAWMGLGDAKLAVGLGYLLGLSRAISGVVVAFWAGAIIGIILLVFSKNHKMKSEIPFAPFLVLGMLIAFLFELRLFPIGL
jgi:leader peptidase (prepilin peptidase)/N-methyltransferase